MMLGPAGSTVSEPNRSEALMELQGKRVVVIGGTSGIGRAVAHQAEALGATVVVASSSTEKVEKARASGADAYVVDVKEEAQIAAFFTAIGSFDHLVYTAGDWGGMGGAPLGQMDLAAAASVFDVRFWGALAAAKHGHGHMPPGGSITFTDGMVAHRPRKSAAVNTAMAGAVEHLVRSLAVELAPIRVNGVCPGYIETEVWAPAPPERLVEMTKRFPLSRAGQPDEAAAAYVYLMCAGYTTGQVLQVDGGMGLV